MVETRYKKTLRWEHAIYSEARLVEVQKGYYVGWVCPGIWGASFEWIDGVGMKGKFSEYVWEGKQIFEWRKENAEVFATTPLRAKRNWPLAVETKEKVTKFKVCVFVEGTAEVAKKEMESERGRE